MAARGAARASFWKPRRSAAGVTPLRVQRGYSQTSVGSAAVVVLLGGGGVLGGRLGCGGVISLSRRCPGTAGSAALPRGPRDPHGRTAPACGMQRAAPDRCCNCLSSSPPRRGRSLAARWLPRP